MLKIEYYLPPRQLTNHELVERFPEWTEEKVLQKTGIAIRHVVSGDETVLDMAEQAVKKLFSAAGDQRIQDVDYLILCTQSPEYGLPSTACLLHERIGLSKTAGAVAIDHGCSGYVYGLSLAKGLLCSGIAKCVLLVTSETYSKFIAPEDKSTLTIFGDGAAATLLDMSDADAIGAFSLGTDGSGAEKLIRHHGGTLKMDGPEIFNFTLDVVPKTLDDVCAKNGLTRDDIDLYVFHQANKFMLDTIRKVNSIPKAKFYIDLENTGNTVSSTIPIALVRAKENGVLKHGMKVMVMGFGVGLSWGATIINF